MALRIRRAVPADESTCARIVYDAFKDVNDRHGFSSGFPTPETALRVVRVFLGLSSVWSGVAEADGRIVGTLFHDEGDPIHGVALVSVDPGVQGRGIGRRLMATALARAVNAAGVRLVQEAFNLHALGLYTSLGFSVKEPLARVVGTPPLAWATLDVRRLGADDVDACDDLYRRVQGWSRGVDLRDAVRTFPLYGAVRERRIVACGYILYLGTFAWVAGETDDDVRALAAGVGTAVNQPIGFNAPTRSAFFQGCVAAGFRVEKPMNLMARGAWQEPRGCYLPSGIY
jgi:ribosomal protein S18 acetylase RimI-like enzyme